MTPATQIQTSHIPHQLTSHVHNLGIDATYHKEAEISQTILQPNDVVTNTGPKPPTAGASPPVGDFKQDRAGRG